MRNNAYENLYTDVKFRVLQGYVRELLCEKEFRRKERENRLLREMEGFLLGSISPENYENWEKIKEEVVNSRRLTVHHEPKAIAFWRDGSKKVIYDEDPSRLHQEEEEREQREGDDNYIGMVTLGLEESPLL